MSRRLEAPAQWQVNPADPASNDSRAAALFESCPEPVPLSDAARLRHMRELASMSARRRLQGGGILAKVLAFTSVFIAPVAFAAIGIDLPNVVVQFVAVFTREDPPAPAPPAPVRRIRSASVVQPAPPRDPELEIEVEATVHVPPRRPTIEQRPALAPVLAEEVPEPPPPVSIDDVRAFAALGDFASAEEALRALVEIGALRPGEEALLRGELHFAMNDCRRSLPYFTQALDAAVAADIEEEALYRRAVCHAWVGDATSSHADIDLYLLLYPQGHYVNVLSHRYRR